MTSRKAQLNILFASFAFAVLLCAVSFCVFSFKAVAYAEEGDSILSIYIGDIFAQDRAYNGSDVVDIDVSQAKLYYQSDRSEVDDTELNFEDVIGTIDNKNVGDNKVVTISANLTGLNKDNYCLVQAPVAVTVDISPTLLSVINIEADDKIYDGNVKIKVTGELSGTIINGDDVELKIAGEVDDKSVGEGKDVECYAHLEGVDRLNYIISNDTFSTTATISQKPIVLSDIAAQSRDYDGTTTVLVEGVLGETFIPGDDVAIVKYGTISDKSAGNSKPVTYNISLSGDDANNYQLTSIIESYTVDIRKKALTVTNIVSQSKVYNGDNIIEVSATLSPGVVRDDDVSLQISGTVRDKNVGNNKAVTYNISLLGVDATNYSLLTIAETYTVDITPKALSVTGIAVTSKIYDGSNDVNVTREGVIGIIESDDVDVMLSGTTSSKDAGNDKPVNVQANIIGTDASNYMVDSLPQNLKTNIIPKSVIVEDIVSQDKVYDGTSNIQVSGKIMPSEIIFGDEVFVVFNANTDDKSAGINKTVTCMARLQGRDSHNYTILNDIYFSTVTVSKREITLINVSAVNREYDGSKLVQLQGGELINLPGIDERVYFNLGIGIIDDKNIGNNKSVSIDITLYGDDSINYNLSSPPDVFVNIMPRKLIIVGLYAKSKTFDESDKVEISGGILLGVCEGEEELVGFTITDAKFLSSEVGSDIEISFDLRLIGDGSSNYYIEKPLIQASIFEQAHHAQSVLMWVFLGAFILTLLTSVGFIIIRQRRKPALVSTPIAHESQDFASAQMVMELKENVRMLERSIQSQQAQIKSQSSIINTLEQEKQDSQRQHDELNETIRNLHGLVSEYQKNDLNRSNLIVQISAIIDNLFGCLNSGESVEGILPLVRKMKQLIDKLVGGNGG